MLDTDASDTGIGAVLSQMKDDGSEVVTAYASRSLSRPERRYYVTRKELLAVVEFVHHFRHYMYLLGREFTLRTDHNSLVWVRNFKEPEGQLARSLQKLEEYNFTIVHHRGALHSNADALSCIPCRQCGRSNHNKDEVPLDDEQTVWVFVLLPVSQDPGSMGHHQLDDDQIQPVYIAVQNGHQPPLDVTKSWSRESRLLLQQWESLRIKMVFCGEGELAEKNRTFSLCCRLNFRQTSCGVFMRGLCLPTRVKRRCCNS